MLGDVFLHRVYSLSIYPFIRNDNGIIMLGNKIKNERGERSGYRGLVCVKVKQGYLMESGYVLCLEKS